MSNATIGKVLCGVLAIACAVLVYTGVSIYSMAKPALSTGDESVVQAVVRQNSLQVKTEKLTDTATQGDDTVEIIRLDGQDKDGPITVYIFIDNGKFAGATYAQNGSGNG